MKNKSAIALKDAANRYYSWKEKKSAGSISKADYEGLIAIANMIENGVDRKIISNAILKLNGPARDIIPSGVYNSYRI